MLNYLQQNTATVLAFGIRKKAYICNLRRNKNAFNLSIFNFWRLVPFPPIQFQPICFNTFCFVLLFSQHLRCNNKYVKCMASWRLVNLWSILSIFSRGKHKQRRTHVPQHPNPTPFRCYNFFNNKYLIICCHIPPPCPSTRKNY